MNPRKEPLPLFCGKCRFARERLFGSGLYCKELCKYNPAFRYSAPGSFFKRKRAIAGI